MIGGCGGRIVCVRCRSGILFRRLDGHRAVNFNTQGLTACVGTVVKGWCTLEQPSFGEVKIEHSVVSIRDGYIDGLTIRGAGYDFDDAIAALKAKFGPPSQIDRLPVGSGSQVALGGTITGGFRMAFSPSAEMRMSPPF